MAGDGCGLLGNLNGELEEVSNVLGLLGLDSVGR
jgi:hypothetical protein